MINILKIVPLMRFLKTWFLVQFYDEFCEMGNKIDVV